jgi:hypothetical protein
MTAADMRSERPTKEDEMTNEIKTRKPDTKPDKDTYESRVSELAASARDLASQVEDGSSRLADRVPMAVDAVRSGAVDAARTVEAMPEATRLMVASLSLGLGAGFFLAGAPRLLTLVAFAPAIAVAGTWMARDPLRPMVR